MTSKRQSVDTCTNLKEILNLEDAPSSTSIPRSAFMATVSHELRTPLNGIIGMTTLLQESTPQTPKQKEYMTILMECSLQLMNLVNNILDFTKMSSKKLKLNLAPLNFIDVINASIKITKSRADFKKLKFEVNVAEDLPKTMIGDAHRILQILVNLLSNAIKFTDRGFVKMTILWRIKEVDDYAKKYVVTVSIQDSGIGLDACHNRSIFDRFSCVEDDSIKSCKKNSSDDSLYTTTNGTGLGLAICKELCELMNGTIRVESQGLRKGSTFIFDIELDENLTSESIQEKYGSFKNKSILIVDDRIEFRIQLTKIILKMGITPIVVSSADEALLHFESPNKFDCAIIDICMPYMSGTELAIELRKLSPSLPLIGVSSLGDNVGSNLFNYFIHKPIDPSHLIKIIADLFTFNQLKDSKLSESSSTDSDCYKAALKDLRVIVAEDEYSNTIVVSEMLKSIGVDEKNIKLTSNGGKCISVLEKSKRGYNLALIDIVMPVKNGIDVFEWISKNMSKEVRSKLTVIAMSAAIENTNKEQCQRYGVDSYLSKPILKSRVEALISSITL